MWMEHCKLNKYHTNGTSWYHSHIGTQSLTCHGALILLPPCSNPASCPCTHVNCGRGGENVWDPIAGDWSPTIGTDVTVNVDVDFPGGHAHISSSVSVTYGSGSSGESSSGSSAGSTSDGYYVESGSQSDSSSSGYYIESGSSSGSNSGSSSLQQGSSSSSSGDNCCKCGCKPSKKAKKSRRTLKPRDDGSSVANPPYAFDTSCSKSPIPYDEERIVILEDMFNAQDGTLAQTALYPFRRMIANLKFWALHRRC